MKSDISLWWCGIQCRMLTNSNVLLSDYENSHCDMIYLKDVPTADRHFAALCMVYAYCGGCRNMFENTNLLYEELTQ